MQYQETFQRYEIKYILSYPVFCKLLETMEPYMMLDQYGFSTIRNIYYDTPDFRLIRHSLSKPIYKEKIRVRSYQCVHDDEQVFVELKKKFADVVYKRRMTLAYDQTLPYLSNQPIDVQDSQIAKEICYFKEFYGQLEPKLFLSYDRKAYQTRQPSSFRMTFDQNIFYRTTQIDLRKPAYGNALLDDQQVLLEIKTATALPMWLSKFLSQFQVYKTSFSKYGKAYEYMMKG